MTHTPGPWHSIKAASGRAGNQAERDYLIHTDDNCHVAEVFQYQSTSIPDGPSEANARLIAAAPDLLGALVFLMKDGHFDECIPGQRGGHPDDERCSQVCTMFRKAIDKATGETL